MEVCYLTSPFLGLSPGSSAKVHLVSFFFVSVLRIADTGSLGESEDRGVFSGQTSVLTETKVVPVCRKSCTAGDPAVAASRRIIF